MADSELRQALESAVSEVEKASAAPAQVPGEVPASTPAPTAAPASAPVQEPPKESPPVEAKKEGTEPAKEVKQPDTAPKPGATPEEYAPKAWKSSAKTKWSTVDPEIRQEIHRRESEMNRAFGENAQARELAKDFQTVVQPYMARIQSTGMRTMEAVNALLQADYTLATAPTHQRAAFMAKLIKDYGVDIKALDAALAGEEPDDPVAARVESLLQQRLRPIQQFLQGQAQEAEQGQRRLQQEAQVTIEQMAADSTKYPHFERVRNDMADLIEFNAQREVYITPAQAYERAVMMDPELQASEIARRSGETQRLQASAANAKAQQALNASSSVASSPAGAPRPGGSGSLRDDLENAFAQYEGR